MSNIPQFVNVSFINAPVITVSKELFSLQILVKVKQVTDDWNTQLSLKMILHQSQQACQTLRIQLIDDKNIQFLYILDLAEVEFLVLKNQQSLYVDFATFQRNLHIYYNYVLIVKEMRNFYVCLETKNGKSTLAVIENNEFKKLSHLSLRLRSAKNNLIKGFLTNKVAIERQDNQEQQKRNKKLSELLEEFGIRKFTEDKDTTIQQLLLDEQKLFNGKHQIQLQDQYISKTQQQEYQYLMCNSFLLTDGGIREEGATILSTEIAQGIHPSVKQIHTKRQTINSQFQLGLQKPFSFKHHTQIYKTKQP